MPQCVHHWMIEEAQGPTSKGICKKCKVERVFENSFYDHDRAMHPMLWEENLSLLRKALNKEGYYLCH